MKFSDLWATMKRKQVGFEFFAVVLLLELLQTRVISNEISKLKWKWWQVIVPAKEKRKRKKRKEKKE